MDQKLMCPIQFQAPLVSLEFYNVFKSNGIEMSPCFRSF
jgi:hypothetical protein